MALTQEHGQYKQFGGVRQYLHMGLLRCHLNNI